MFIKLEYPHVCKVPQQGLKKCLESKWDEIVNKLKKPRNLCKRTSMTDLSLLSIPGTLTAFNNLEWCHHAFSYCFYSNINLPFKKATRLKFF